MRNQFFATAMLVTVHGLKPEPVILPADDYIPAQSDKALALEAQLDFGILGGYIFDTPKKHLREPHYRDPTPSKHSTKHSHHKP